MQRQPVSRSSLPSSVSEIWSELVSPSTSNNPMMPRYRTRPSDSSIRRRFLKLRAGADVPVVHPSTSIESAPARTIAAGIKSCRLVDIQNGRTHPCLRRRNPRAAMISSSPSQGSVTFQCPAPEGWAWKVRTVPMPLSSVTAGHSSVRD